ncbi:hypothetical protein V2J09_011808 [Rumex salicifolius]
MATTVPMPIDNMEISSGLVLSPRIRILITVHRADTSVSPLDEWKLKRSLVDFFRSSFSYTVAIPEEDISVRRFKDLKKRKREDAVAQGSIFIRDLGFVKVNEKLEGVGGGVEDVVRALEQKLSEWRKLIVEKMDGMEVNLEGIKFRLTVSSPVSDDFERIKKEWEEHLAFGNARGFSRSAKYEPDTLILRGLPSRWFAEPRLTLNRNLNVAEDDDLGKDADEDGTDIVPGLNCKIVVQFEKYSDFCNAIKILCGRSLQKEGSRLKADYELSWDKDEFFRSGRNLTQGKSSWAASQGQYRNEPPRRQPYDSRYSPDRSRTKRFKE